MDKSRRQFLEMSGAAAAAIGLPLTADAGPPPQPAAGSTPSLVYLSGDGIGLEPSQYAAELTRLCAASKRPPDEYGLGGIVADAEVFFAKLLGKERALFMPTGTLANHLAIRALAGERRRVVVQDVSHVYNDTGDGCQMLSSLTLLPLAPERATFTWADVDRVLSRTASGRVATGVGAISIESPVRRRAGELFDRAEMTAICTEARKRGIRTHLDGARLFIASAYTGISPADYAAPFDTVYVSLWKCFNSQNGAILAGPASVLDGMFHARRMFGGALWNAWPFALMAQRYAEGFVERLTSAVAVSEAFMREVAGPRTRIERVPNGSNIFRLIVTGRPPEALRDRLRVASIVLPAPAMGPESAVFTLQVNESWNRTTGARLAAEFSRALAG